MRGGAGPIAQRMADQLSLHSPGSVLLEAPVQEVIHDSQGVVVRTEGDFTIRASAVVVAVPPQQRLAIQFQPSLPAAHAALVQRSPMGVMTKILAIYDQPFWRHQGLNGLGIGNLQVLELTADSGPPEGTPGILAGFASGERALRLGALDPDQQREAILRDLKILWGPQACEPMELVVKPWTAEPWIGGAFTSFPMPGCWTSHASVAAGEQGGPGPCDWGRVLWAGTEASPRWPGYFEGALEAGERAARAAQELCSVG